ncbi:MAG: SusD/RagB family nutrient-binding outer membrane lipoprotein [Cyclobacteriaceae bacterium]
MKKILNIISLVTLVFTLSCQDLLDVNVDPARVSPDDATLGTLLPTAIRFSSSSIYGASERGILYTQQFSGQAIAQYTPYGFDQLWRPFYTDALPTLQDIIVRAEESGAFNYSGIAKTLLAINLMNTAAIFGDAPYSEANQGTSVLYPCYDNMEELYTVHIIGLLNEAIEDLARPLSDLPTLRTVQNDFIYNGDLAQWTKAARAVRARYYLHMSNRQPGLLTNAAQDAQLAFESNSDDLQLTYEDNNPNPWFGFIGNAVNKIMQPSSYFVDIMSGNGHFENAFDPRIDFYMTKTGTSTEYVGLTPGRLVDDEVVNVNIQNTNWPVTIDAPILFITYAEIQFILAEAQFTSSKPNAYAAYLEGIRASMEKVGVPEEDIDDYINNPEISVGADNLTLADIMLQKYVALFYQIEVWNDMRRYQYDPSVYVGIEKPVNNQIPGNPWIQRSNIADDEPGVNTCLPEPVANQGVVLWLFE